jgi:hypothetical protein
MQGIRFDKKGAVILGFIIYSLLVPISARAATIDDVVFLNKIQEYETVVSTTLVTQEGKRIPIPNGTRLNIAGFTRDQAFVISRTDRPNGFVPKEDITPRRRPSGAGENTIKEETLE